MTLVKTCGLSSAEAVDAALAAGADYLGFIHFLPSPRHVELDALKALAAHTRGLAKTVAVVVDASDDLLIALDAMPEIDLLQIHGHESIERVGEIAHLVRTPLIKALAVATREDVAAAQGYLPHVQALLFDAKAPKAGGYLPGGNGLTFDWRILDADWLKETDWLLSGGLTVETVATAIELTGAPGVDVSSGIERAPGVKDLDKIAAFVAAAKGR